jgi:hypothetical protein
MPWHVEKRGDQHCVIKDADGSQVACHGTAAEAQAQVRALYASESLEKERDVNAPGSGHNLRE